jgi:co-chaperonin GroES (HSP10)
MQTTLEINRLKPIGTKVLIKRGPVETHTGILGKIEIPQEYRDRNDLKGLLFTGTVIAVGDRTKSSRYGREKGHFEPGDKIWFWHMYDWKDHEVVLKDSESGDDYLIVDESEIKAYEISEGQAEAA